MLYLLRKEGSLVMEIHCVENVYSYTADYIASEPVQLLNECATEREVVV